MTLLRFVILLVAAALAPALFAQFRPTAPGPWTVGVRAGAGVGFRTLYDREASQLHEEIIGIRNEREVPRLATGTVVSFAKRLGKHVGIELGVGYAQLGWKHRVDLDARYQLDQVDVRNGFIYAADAVLTKVTYSDRLNYVEAPVGVTFQFGRGHVRSVSSIGLGPAILAAARGGTVFEYADGSRNETRYPLATDTFTFNCFGYVSTGLALRVGKLLEWRLQPTVRYGLLDLVNAPITAKVQSVTLDIGARITL